MIAFAQLGCTDETRAAFEAACAELSAPAGVYSLGRVTSLDRSLPAVTDAGGQRRCELSAAIKKSGDSQVAVGDWVVLDTAFGHEHPVICRILPRRGALRRVKRVGREGQVRVQVLAANVDRVFVCQSLSGTGLDMDLLVRQMAAVRACGARCSFVFTKADLVEPGEAAAALARAGAAMPDVDALASPACAVGGVQDDAESDEEDAAESDEEDAAESDEEDAAQAGGEGRASSGDAGGGGGDDTAGGLARGMRPVVEHLRRLCPPGSTALFLGESGVGKSTLANALVGAQAQQTGVVRARDDKGRHTTVARRMLAVPDGGVVVDAPGLRTLQVLDAAAALRAGFPDIAALAPACRFRDCTHGSEPGCAVRGAVVDARLAAYVRLAAGLAASAPSRRP